MRDCVVKLASAGADAGEAWGVLWYEGGVGDAVGVGVGISGGGDGVDSGAASGAAVEEGVVKWRGGVAFGVRGAGVSLVCHASRFVSAVIFGGVGCVFRVSDAAADVVWILDARG